MQGESREDLSPFKPPSGVFSLERSCGDSVLESWYSDSFPGFIERCRDLIIDEAGAGNVGGLILSGSFASGEGSVMMLGGDPVFLSDIDLLLVTSTPASHAGIYSRRTAIGKACEELLPGARFDGRIDMGVMTLGELAAMPRSPGVFDMREKGVLLKGRSDLLARFPDFTADEIGPGEAVRLLENRMAALLGNRPGTDRPGGVDLYRFLYGISRIYTDIVTASLCAEGMYLPGYRARSDFISSSAEASQVRGKLGDSLIADAVKWTGFKIDPGAEEVWTVDSRASHLWLEAAGDLLAVRDSISLQAGWSAADAGLHQMDLLRAWKAVAAELPLIGRFRLLAGALLSGRDPGAHLREESVRLIRHATEKGTGGVVGAAAAWYPHGRTSWEHAASMTSSAWRRLVTAREDESLE